MLRTLPPLLLGAAIAAGAAYLLHLRDEPTRGAAAPSGSFPSPDAAEPPPAGSLEARAVELAQERPSAARDLRLATLLARLAESDPAAAARVGRATGVDPAVARLLFTAWAEADFDAAVASLATYPPAEAQELALALLRTLGNDAERSARLAEYLPAEQRPQFIANAIAARGAAAPVAALRQAIALDDPGARSLALTLLAQRWGNQDPRQALLHLPEIANAQEREAFRDAVLAQWVYSEPLAVLEYLIDLDPIAQQRHVFQIAHNVPIADLERILDRADGLDRTAATALRQTAIQRLAREDPAAALARLATFSAAERRQLQASIAHAYGAKDPEAAFAWARALEPRDPQAVLGVLNGIAETNPERAFELALSLDTPAEREQAVAMFASVAYRDRAAAERLLNRVLAVDEGTRYRAVLGLIGAWSSADPAAAFEWLAANQHAVPVEAFQQVAAQLSAVDPVAAASYVARVPPDARASFLATVAGAYAQRDPEAAVAWLEQYRGDPAYRQAVVPVVGLLALQDGARAARLLDSAGEHGRADLSAVISLLSGWAQNDPAAAANWSLGLADPAVRSSALQMTIQQWSIRDPNDARRWVLGLPPGGMRDEALTGLASSPFVGDSPDEVLAAFTSDAARNRAVMNMAMQLASSGRRDAARALVEQRMSDSPERERAIAMIEQVGARIRPTLVRPPIPGFRQLGPSVALPVLGADGVVVAPPSTIQGAVIGVAPSAAVPVAPESVDRVVPPARR